MNIAKFKTFCQENRDKLKARLDIMEKQVRNPDPDSDFLFAVNPIIEDMNRTEAKMYAFGAFCSCHNDHTKESLLLCLSERSTNFVDDTWSGRGNDLRRIKRDGQVEAWRDILDFIRYE